MKTAGVSVDKVSIAQFFKNIEGATVVEHVAAGSKKTISMPSGGGGARAGPAAAAGPAVVVEEKKEEKEEVDMGGLFGDDDEY